MPIEQIWDEEYPEFISSNNAVLVLGEDWCPDCRGYDSIITYVARKAAEKEADIRFGKVMIDDRSKSMRTIKITHGKNLTIIPYTVLYKRGEEVHSFPNVQSNGYIREQIAEHLGIEI